MTTTTQDLDLGIRRAALTDRTTVAATVAAGFFDDPVTEWLLPDLQQRRQVIQPVFQLHVDAYLGHGETYLTAGGRGASVWLPPGAELFTPDQAVAFGDAVAELLGPSAERAGQVGEIFAEHHPQEPLYYCQFLATDPALQGRGIGSALLRRMLERADVEGMPAYLEASSPRNRALYERHGFVSLGAFTLPDGGPTLSRMWREPQQRP